MAKAEMQRLDALHNFAVLDSLPEARFDRLTALAAALFDAPIALVSLIDKERQWFKSRFGLDATETPRAWAFCDHTIKGRPDATLVVEDATSDPRFSDNPLVTGDLGIRFYAGAALTTADGHNIGTLCVIDRHARQRPTDAELNRLTVLARMVVDELELARATRELAEQKRVLQLAEAMSGVGHWRLGLADRKPVWSDEMYRIHGVDRESFDLTLDNALDFYHPDDRVAVVALIDDAIAKGEDFAFQLRLIIPSGAIRHVICKASCEFDERGALTAVIGVFRDVTAEMDRLAVVAESEARYRLLADNASDMVCQLSPSGYITFITPSCLKILGHTPEEMMGQADSNVHPDDVAAVITFYACLRRREPTPTEAMQFRARHREGHWVWLEGQPRMLFDEAGEPVMIQDTVRDISQRKALEFELDQARIEAEAASLVKSEFMANMSHELRTPLTSIVGFSGLLLNTVELSPQGKRYVERVTQASGALLTLVNDILDFSKLEAGQVEVEQHPADTVDMLEGALELLRPQAEAKGLSLIVDYRDLPRTVMVDEGRVRQILLNLVSNAVKFTSQGGVTVRASYDHTRSRLLCEVIDTGEGVPADRIDRLFKRFSQVDASTTRAHGGTGLGLAISKGLAEAMGGVVGADSRLGVGSCFWFDLPCPIVGASGDPADDEATEFGGLRVLVADDNPLNRELVRIILESSGVQVIDAGSGSEALDLAEAGRFDLILMDIRMPDLDGPAAACAIRSGRGPNADTPIIAFSADEVDPTPGGTPLFDGYLAKPVLAADLLATVSGRRDLRRTMSAAALSSAV